MLKVRNPGPFSDQSPVLEIRDASLIRDIMRLSGLKQMEIIEAADGESIFFLNFQTCVVKLLNVVCLPFH